MIATKQALGPNTGRPHNIRDSAAEDARIERLAARETALGLAIATTRKLRTACDLLAIAVQFEEFMLAHPASGQQALEMAIASFAGRADYSSSELLEAAISFEAWLSGNMPSADAHPQLLRTA